MQGSQIGTRKSKAGQVHRKLEPSVGARTPATRRASGSDAELGFHAGLLDLGFMLCDDPAFDLTMSG